MLLWHRVLTQIQIQQFARKEWKDHAKKKICHGWNRHILLETPFVEREADHSRALTCEEDNNKSEVVVKHLASLPSKKDDASASEKTDGSRVWTFEFIFNFSTISSVKLVDIMLISRRL